MANKGLKARFYEIINNTTRTQNDSIQIKLNNGFIKLLLIFKGEKWNRRKNLKTYLARCSLGDAAHNSLNSLDPNL